MRQEVLFRDKNFLYSGDNLDILRYRIASESVDLVYLDPPFNSNQDYNVLFKERGGERVAAQIKAFGDTWRWDRAAAESYRDTIENAPELVANAMQAFRTLLGPTDMLAYLSMMAPRLVEMHRVLRDTGSIFLHCDPTASHYLKLLMDAIFDARNFRNEIVWKRTSAHSDVLQGARHMGRVHDVLLFYSKSEAPTWNPQFLPYTDEYIRKTFRSVEPDGRRYQTQPLHAKQPGGDTRYEWKGKLPPPGRYWAYSRANMEALEAQGRIAYSRTGTPRYKIYLDESPGRLMQDWWGDIAPVHNSPKERLPYPTQKPIALLERIIKATTNKGDTVLDPFCGCGTSIDAAQLLGRRWVGIDITQVAIDVVRERLRKQYGEGIDDSYTLIRNPASVADALALAADDKYQFQWWVLDRLGASEAPRKKGRDKGVDGRLNFYDDPKKPPRRIVISVKGGKTGPGHVRDLRGVMDRDKATIGVFVSIKEPTHQMRVEALTAGVYHSQQWDRDYERLQFLTAADLVAGKQIDYPSGEWHLVSSPRSRRRTTVPKESGTEKMPRAAASKSAGARASESIPRRKPKS